MSKDAEEALRKGIRFCKVVREDHDDCGGSAFFGSGLYVCDRCAFRRKVINGVWDGEDDDFIESEDDGWWLNMKFFLRWGPSLWIIVNVWWRKYVIKTDN